MRFRSYDTLKIFDAVARNLSMTKAADELHQSKGSISYQKDHHQNIDALRVASSRGGEAPPKAELMKHS